MKWQHTKFPMNYIFQLNTLGPSVQSTEQILTSLHTLQSSLKEKNKLKLEKERESTFMENI